MSGIILNRLKMIIQTVHSQREIGIFESRLQYLSPNYVVSRNIFARQVVAIYLPVQVDCNY